MAELLQTEYQNAIFIFQNQSIYARMETRVCVEMGKKDDAFGETAAIYHRD